MIETLHPFSISTVLAALLPLTLAIGCAETQTSATTDFSQVQLYGRWDATDPSRRVANWGPVAIGVAFEGTSISIRLTDEQVTAEELSGTGNYYQYSIDDGPFVVLPSSAETEYLLAEDLEDTTHTLFFVRRTESLYGRTTFAGFVLDEGKKLLPPPPAPSRKIEVLGDSISTGLANENTGTWSNADQNGYMAFGPQLARRLDAQWHVEARGGGAFYDTWLPMRGFFEKVFGPYEGVHNPPGGEPDWDFSSWQPDVFVLALGTNDFSYEYTPHIDEALYVAEYKEFLGVLRALYPSAEIICLAPFKEGEPWDEARAYIPKAVEEMNDPHIAAVVPYEDGQSWLVHPQDFVDGDEFHPNIDGHTKIAEKLAGIINDRMGW